ncbi:sigma-70 family RNA polymerase sigma factor [Kibdelosporangium aridum]|uniref:Sigma-70 family RNA polymerase sigma factor n=1 Tax=Kibdelosporangium aridum TaxID=2030 RepID=A0A428ZAD6_KIBAR|nr:sigma-70 family RNA polymerase sigma factor [Kibdelosporangium aridum]
MDIQVDSSHPPWDGLQGAERYAVCLRAARAGNQAARAALVEDLTPLVWHVARGNGLSRATAEDVVQTVWLALFSHINSLAEPRALASWLITTTRRESQRARGRANDLPLTDEMAEQLPSTLPQPEDEAIRVDRDTRLWRAFAELPEKCQELLRLTVLAGRSEYRVVAEAMQMKRGSIGPTRGRCLKVLRELLESQDNVTSFPVSIYLSDEAGHERVQAAVEQLVTDSGADIVHRDEPVLGSWFRKLRAAAKTEVGRQAVTSAVHALESRLVLEQDAKVTAAMMANVGPVLTSLQPTKDAVIRIGAVLIVKVDWTVAVHQLTAEQQLLLDHQPHLLTSPCEILRAISPPANGHRGAIEPRPDDEQDRPSAQSG